MANTFLGKQCFECAIKKGKLKHVVTRGTLERIRAWWGQEKMLESLVSWYGGTLV